MISKVKFGDPIFGSWTNVKTTKRVRSWDIIVDETNGVGNKIELRHFVVRLFVVEFNSRSVYSASDDCDWLWL